ncbi:hypothetical protein [Lacipirellula limnantheis]|uniref:Uncharacterized protein n=1 Tax=Lacipirellula limnantheis TaxID=2528024 RepID=A0A517U6W5_9BACT|nr:hypothetical protein [Lacipirellula limnantheis]QDT76372.1 hypothetical protein I41_56220 [Lacipirellula limnantheis]
MDKPTGFQSDLAAMHDEMQQVAKMLEATRLKAPAKTVEIALGTLGVDATAAGARVTPSRPRKRLPASLPPALPQRSRDRANVTTRLSAETNELLTEAALRQKLKRVAPNTRQDIIETAVCQWLAQQGYARQRRPAEPAATTAQPSDEGIEDDAWQEAAAETSE